VYFSVPGIAEQALEKNKDITDDDIVNIINKFEQVVVNPLLNESTLANFKALNDKELLLELDRESIAASQIVSGKKRYALKLLDDEGVRLSHPKYKIVWLDIKRSSTPSLMRKKLDDALRLLFDGKNKDAVEFIKTFEKEYKAKKYPITEISTPTGISDLDKFEGGDLSVPIHVRTSILHNKIVKEMGLDNISPICSGDKIKWVYLKPNNKYGSNVIAYNDPDFMTITGLADKIDYAVMFEKTFMTALEKLIDAVGWKMNSSAIAMNELF